MESFEKLLIERVRQIDLIYNTRTRLYKNPEKREASWLGISQHLGVKVEHCRQRWKSLRDRFVREHRKMISSPGSEVWEHYHQMLFLKDYLKQRTYNTIGYHEYSQNHTIPPVQVKLEESEKILPETEASESRIEDTDFNASESFRIPDAEQEFSDGGNYSLEDLSNSTETPSKKFKTEVEDAFVDLIGDMSRLVDKKRNAASPPEETENSLFMKMIAKKLDSLPITSQGALQVEILTLVNNEVNKYVKGN